VALSLDELTSLLDAPEPAPGATRGQTATPARYQSPQQWRTQLGLDDLEEREHLPSGLLTAVLTRESRGYPTAKSPKGAQGLFQFMPATAKSYGIDPLDPRQAAEAAAKELGSHYKRYGGDVPQTLAAWNWGSGNLQKQGLANAPKETRNFISWVTGLLSPQSAEAAERPRTQGARQAPAGPLTVEGLEQLLGTAASAQPPTQAPGPPPAAIPATAPQNAPQATTGPQGGVPLGRAPTQPLVDPRASQTGPRPTAPSDLVVDIEKPSAGQGPPAEDPRLLADLPGWAKVGLATGTGALGSLGGAALLGGGVGFLTGGAGAAPAAVAGEMGGSYLARKLNVALGLEEPGIVGDVASGVLPGVFRGLGAAWRGGLRQGVVPGTGAVRHEMAKEALEGLEGRLVQGTPAADLWTLARQSNPDVATLQSWQTAGKVLREKKTAPGLTANDPGRLAMQDMLDMVKRTGGPVSIEDLDNFRRTLIPHLRDPGVKQLYGAILDDMENAAARGVSGAGTLRQAIARTRYEHSLDDLADLWKPGGNIKVTDGDQVQVFGKTMQNAFERKMHDNPLFAKAFAPEDLADIRKTFTEVAKLTNVSLKPGGGLMGHLAMLPLAGMAGYAGYEQGGWKQGTAQALAVESFPFLMAMAMGTPMGRAAIRNAINKGGGKIGPAEMGGILTALREAGAFSGAIPTEERQTTRAPGGPARSAD
jgi:hypothetical protein